MLFLTGLFIAAMGVAFSAKAGLGTSPVASVPYSVSLVSSVFTFGGWLNVLSVLQIIIQVLLLRKGCKPVEIIIQTVLAFAYGYLTDFCCMLIEGMTLSSYFQQLLCMLASCFILAFGIWIQFKGDVAMLPGEAMNRAIAAVTGKRYENIKIFFDILYIGISSAISFAAFGQLRGVREGSIIAAVLIGCIIKIYNRIFDKLNKSHST